MGDNQTNRDGGSRPLPGLHYRLTVSAAVALALGWSGGAVFALHGVLQFPDNTILFPAASYLLESSALVVGLVLVGMGALSLLLWLSVFLWRSDGAGVRSLLVVSAVSFALLLLGESVLGILSSWTLPYWLLLLVALWSCATALLDSPLVQITCYPVFALAVLLALTQLPVAPLLLLVGGAWVWGAHRAVPQGDVRGYTLRLLPPLALLSLSSGVLVLFMGGVFLLPLDLAPTLAWVAGIIVMGALLVLANRPVGSRLRSRALPWIAAALLVSVVAGVFTYRPTPPPEVLTPDPARPSMVLIVWDTARAQSLELYGYEGSTAPHLVEFAQQGVTFERATASASWTLPTHASMFTGKYPRSHAATSSGYHQLLAEHETLAEQLAAAGYENVALSGNSSFVTRDTGLHQGFDIFTCATAGAYFLAPQMRVKRSLFSPWDESAESISDLLRRWLFLREDPARPFFLFINIIEPHVPYTPYPPLLDTTLRQRPDTALMDRLYVEPPPSPWDFDQLHALYAAEIRFTDQMTREYLDLLDAAAGGDFPGLTVITADHGEGFGEHGRVRHLFHQYESVLHVPLVVRWPGHVVAGDRRSERVSSMDIYALLRESSGLPALASPEVVGRNPLSPSFSAASARYLIAETWVMPTHLHRIHEHYQYGTPLGRFVSPLFAVYQDDWKYLTTRTGAPELLFNLAQDPGEENNVAGEHPEVVARLSAALEKWLQETPDHTPTFADGYEVAPPD